MNIFMSWSGARSKKMGEFLSNWIPKIFPSSSIFFSPDIPTGEEGFNTINNELGQSDIGIFLFTRENIDSIWMGYEAGAIKHNHNSGKVLAIFLDEGLNEVNLGPFHYLQHANWDGAEFVKVIRTINDLLESKRLNPDRLTSVLDEHLPDYLDVLNAIRLLPLTLPDGGSTPSQNLTRISNFTEITKKTSEAILGQLHLIVKHMNSDAKDGDIPIEEVQRGINAVNITMQAKQITLPDGTQFSQVSHHRIPPITFKTWEAAYIYFGKNRADFRGES